MRIAFVTSKSLSRHATIKRAWGMAPDLIESGHDVAVVCEDCEENRSAVNSIVGLRGLYFRAGLGVVAERKAKAACLRQFRPAVVHICGLGWRNAMLREHSSIRYLMDHVELESAIPSTSRIRRVLQHRLELWSFLYYSGTVVASKYLEYEVLRLQLRKRRRSPIIWLPFAFDSGTFRASESEIAAAKSASSGRKVIAYMGGLYENYGVRELVEAYRSSRKLTATSKLVFVGRGPESVYLKRNVCADLTGPQIEYRGFIDEKVLIPFLLACDVLVSPLVDTIQDWARCPSKTYMYMATRRPVVTSEIGENREALGPLGFYYRPGDRLSMVSALEKAMAVEGYVSYSLEDHTWKNRVAKYVSWLNEFSSRGLLE